jgi:Tfp pilus assembly protein PilN
MIGTNLSTRPFYNVRAVRAVLGLVALLVAVVTVVNIARVVSLRASEGTLSARATDALEDANSLRAEALSMRAQIDPRELEAIAAAARDANEVLERRAFSWSVFLGQLEATLPDDVRVTAVQPYVEGGAVQVSMVVEAQSAEHLAEFMDALEDQSTFTSVLPPETRNAADGIIDATIVARYIPPAPAGRGAPPDGAQP